MHFNDASSGRSIVLSCILKNVDVLCSHFCPSVEHMVRASAYLHDDGEEATVAELSLAFASSASALHEKNLNLYHSTDMKVGILIPELQSMATMLAALMRIDARGGHFRQSHVEAALAQSLDKSKLLSVAVDAGMTYDDILGMTAYKVRVMCSHCRLVHDAVAETQGHPLALVLEILKESNAGLSDARRARRHQRLDKRPHPFQAFRPQEDATTAVEDILVVCKYWDGTVAKQLLSDGTEINADLYEQTDDGFACAIWLGPYKTRLQLDVANSRCVDGKITAAPTPKAKAKSKAKSKPTANTEAACKRPAAKRPRSEDEAEEGSQHCDDGDDFEAQRQAEHTVQGGGCIDVMLRVNAGHGTEMCVSALAAADCKDKAQVLAVSSSQCRAGMTPMEACHQVVVLAQHFLGEKQFQPPVRGAAWLTELRQHLRELRSKVTEDGDG